MFRAFLMAVGVPTLTAALYFGLIASNIYVSETRFAIRSSDDSPASGLLASMLGASSASSSGDDSNIVRDYILSRDMLVELEERLSLRAHYSSESVDAFSRLSKDASEEAFLDYYRTMVEVTMEFDITTLSVRAFEPELAQNIGENLIALSEALVNGLSDRIIKDTLRFARTEVDLAESRVKHASDAVTLFRKERQSIDPGEETSAVLGIVTMLEGAVANARAELAQAETFMRRDSAQVRNLRARVAAVERQVTLERQRLAGEDGSDLTRLIEGYEPLILDQKLAEQRYASALISMEVSRAEAQRKQRYLVAFIAPQMPDEAVEPRRLLKVATVFAAATLIFGVGGLVMAAIEDHAGL